MTAYPEDVPVPNKDLEFTIDSPSIQSIENALNQIEEANKLAEEIDKIKEYKDKIEVLLNQALEVYSLMVHEADIEVTIDGDKPDLVRMEAGLNVPVIERIKGKPTETTVTADQFKKLVK